MKPSPLRVAITLLAFLCTNLLPDGHARSVGDNKDRDRANNNRPNQSRPQQQQRPSAPKSSGSRGSAAPPQGARNPLTGSSVSRESNARPNAPRPNQGQGQGQNNRPNQADNRPKDRPSGNNDNRPGPKGPNQPDNRPGDRPNQPETRPAPIPKGPNQPENRPAPKGPNQPENRPGGKGPGGNANNNRPAPRPPAHADKRPGNNNNDNRPGDRPNHPNQPNRPGGHTPFVPGKVTYPGQIAKPSNRPGSNNNVGNNNNININNSNRNRPVNHPNRIAKTPPRSLNQVVAARSTNINSGNINVNNSTNINVNNSTHNNWGNQWTNNNTTIWNNNQTTYRGPVVINQNFKNSVNYAYRPTSWGSRPWWSSSTYHNWHHGSWNYGWNNSWHSYHRPVSYDRPPVYLPGYRPYVAPRPVVPWGIAAWSLGSLYYDSGYSTYRNPYQAPPVQTQTTIINYTQPLSVVASKEVPRPQEAAKTAEEMSSAALERARDAFSNGDYLAALKSTDESISYAASDPALHEFRGLCLFALARYGDAAGVLNPVLASGPGWDWATMSAFYSDGEIYTNQLRKLEAYVESSPDSADSHFLLGYHYLVAGFVDEAYGMFDRVTTLQPADTVAVQLRNLTGSSSPTASPEEAVVEATTDTPSADLGEGVVVETISPDDLIGGWNAASGDGNAITLTLSPDGPFVWNYAGAADAKVLSGEWSIDEEGQLILAAEDVQMVASISLNGDTLQFILAGSPVGDPGLSFQRIP